MESRLEVSVGANISELSKNLAKGQKDISSFSTNASKELSKLDAVSKSGGQTLDKFSAGSNRAAFALQNLGRVAQDAPFGFIGIQNNLNPLLESFAQLRKESVSNAAALKALGSSLIGPAGIGIALSVVSAGILLYQEYTRKAAKETEELNKKTEDYAKTLHLTNQVALKGQQNAQEELITLDLLFKAATNVSLGQKERYKAADQLQQQFPATFKNYTDEQIILGQVGTAYEDLSKQILANAKARAGVDFLVENAKQELLLQTRINNAKEAEGRLLVEQKQAQAILSQGNVADTKAAQQKLLITKLTNSLVEKGAEDIGKVGFLQIQLNKLKKEDLKIATLINEEIAKGATLDDTSPDAKGPSKQIEQIRKQLSLVSTLGQNTSIIQFPAIGTDLLAESVGKIGELLGRIQSTTKTSLSGATLELLRFNDAANKIIEGGIEDTFSGLASAIGNGLANGGNIAAALGSTLLTSFGNIAIQLGQLAIGTGIAVEGIKKALTSLAGPIAIAAGVALIALGSFVKGAAAKIGTGGGSSGGYKIPGFATGVSNFGGGMALVGERGPELVTLGRGSNVITNENISRYGKSNSMPNIILQEAVIRGQDIIIVQKRAQTKLSKVI